MDRPGEAHPLGARSGAAGLPDGGPSPALFPEGGLAHRVPADALSRRSGFGSLGAEPLAEEIEGML